MREVQYQDLNTKALKDVIKQTSFGCEKIKVKRVRLKKVHKSRDWREIYGAKVTCMRGDESLR